MTNAEATNRTTTETTAREQETPATAKGKPTKTAAVRAQATRVAPGKAKARKQATPGRKRASKKTIKLSAAKNPTTKPAKVAKPPKAGAPRPDSKAAKVLAMIGTKSGASIAELRKATGWLPHTLRAFISVANRKLGLKIQTSKNSAGERVYAIGR